MTKEYNEDMLEQEAINKYLNMIANDYNGELAKIFQEKYINKDKEIERLNNIINEIKLCNSDYYNQICTLSSKLSLINIFINEYKNCVPKHITDYVNKVIFDKNIKLGNDKE